MRNLVPKFESDTATQGQEGVALIEQALKAGRPYSLGFVDIHMLPCNEVQGFYFSKHLRTAELKKIIEDLI